jgi:hypothetical protein
MDHDIKRIIIIVLAQGALAILLLAVHVWRRHREKTLATESVSAPEPETVVRGPQPWVWVATVVLIAAVGVLWRPCSTWNSSHFAPIKIRRSELLEAASKEINCPAEQLTIEPFGDREAKVSGCGGNTRLCWRKGVGYAWRGCYVPY